MHNNENFQLQSKWISLLQCENAQSSHYYKTFLNAKFTQGKIRDYNLHAWPLNTYVPDMVRS